MKNCWNLIPEERPLFGDIAKRLSAILGSDEQRFIDESECEDLGYRRVQFAEAQPNVGVLNEEEYELGQLLP